MRGKKLYRHTTQAYRLPHYMDAVSGLVTTEASNIPFLHWPDGRWCLAANLYLIELYKRGLSRFNRGGTLFTYATSISHLIRFCFERRIEFIEMTDSDFTEFVVGLGRETTRKKRRIRNENGVISIGRCCLDFLSSVGRNSCDDSFVGPAGRISCHKRENVRSNCKGKATATISYWHHVSFPTASPKSKRMPISSDAIAKLREAIDATGSSPFLRKRRYVTHKLLEITGARRSEVAAVTTHSVFEAVRSEQPLLRLTTLKKRSPGRTRLLPIHPHDARFLLEYIEVNRRRIIRRTIGESADHGFLLISERTGLPLQAETISKEFSLLARAAGIVERSCAHMYRHRFITKLFVALIEAHNFQNQDEFRRSLLDLQTFKQKVTEWTGQNVEALDDYIHLAFEEMGDFRRVIDLVSMRTAVDSFDATIRQAITEIRAAQKRGESGASLLESFALLLGDFSKTLRGSHTG